MMAVCILILSQLGFNISVSLLTDNNSVMVKQITHLTTSLFLLFVGSFLEYSPRTDFYCLLIASTIVIAKMINGHALV